MREVAGSTPGLDFYILCEPIYVSLSLIICNKIGMNSIAISAYPRKRNLPTFAMHDLTEQTK
jgi:hypothetical protein